MRYPLAGLFLLRVCAERARTAERAAAAGEVAGARHERDAREEATLHEEARCSAVVLPASAGAAAWAWQAAARVAVLRRQARDAAGGRLREAEAALERSEATLEACREELAAAVRARAALARHRDAWRSARRRALEKAEEGEAEDARAATAG